MMGGSAFFGDALHGCLLSFTCHTPCCTSLLGALSLSFFPFIFRCIRGV